MQRSSSLRKNDVRKPYESKYGNDINERHGRSDENKRCRMDEEEPQNTNPKKIF